jgi:hypothetical protein
MSLSMTHYYEKNIVDIKKEYTDQLVSLLTPVLYEGFQSMYKRALTTESQYQKMAQTNPQVNVPSIMIVFQFFLRDLNKLSTHMIENEVTRIKNKSGCADYFDDLVRACIKSYIVLLTYNASGKTCKLVQEKFHETIETTTFVHKCYIECARIFYDHTDLFWHKYTTNEIKHNQRVIYQLIKVGITKALRLMCPMQSILKEYLNKDYIEEDEEEYIDNVTKFRNINDIVQRDLGQPNKKNSFEEDDMRKIIVSSETSIGSLDNKFAGIEREVIDLNDFIYNRKLDGTIEETPQIDIQKNMPSLVQADKLVEHVTPTSPHDKQSGSNNANADNAVENNNDQQDISVSKRKKGGSKKDGANAILMEAIENARNEEAKQNDAMQKIKSDTDVDINIDRSNKTSSIFVKPRHSEKTSKQSAYGTDEYFENLMSFKKNN